MKNLFSRFQDLALERQSKSIGTCVSADFGECWVELPGGSLLRVKGAGVVGTRYFVLNGRIDGEAPALESLVIEV